MITERGTMILIYHRRLLFALFFALPFVFSTTFVATTKSSDDISIKYHNRYSKPLSEHRSFHHPVSVRPTSVGHTSNSSPSLTYRHTSPPTKSFYKSASSMEIRRNGSISEVPIMRWKPPPNINPWYTLYRPSSAPQYHHQTKRPVELSWKPAHVMLEEVPKVPLSKIQETNIRHHSTPKESYNNLYGSHEGIKYLKGHYGPTNLSEAKSNVGITQDLEDVRLANEHFLRIRSSARCKVPAPEVVCVKDLYPNPTKEYLPRCTLLHRCGDRSGCCDSETLKCVPRAIQEVALNFYIVHLDMPANKVGLENSVEKLLFSNHTDCECMPKTDPPSDKKQLPNINENVKKNEKTDLDQDTILNEDLPLQDNHKELRLNVVDQEDDDEVHSGDHQKAKCRECPMPFSLRKYSDGRCSCDCFDKHKPCLRIKRGRESLMNHEKRCVQSNVCNIPECEYGAFIMTGGRCPKKPEDFQKPGKSASHNPRSLHNPNHRWIYFERD